MLQPPALLPQLHAAQHQQLPGQPSPWVSAAGLVRTTGDLLLALQKPRPSTAYATAQNGNLENGNPAISKGKKKYKFVMEKAVL
jgi:hypothetical protein